MPKLQKTEEPHAALQNVLLAALPSGEFEKIAPFLDEVTHDVGDILWESEEKNTHVYFPVTSLICLLYESEEGVSIEVGIIGRSGLVGISTVMIDPRMSHRAVAYRAGISYRMKASEAQSEFSDCGDFQDMTMCYTQTLIAQVSQSAICNRLHSVEQQLCRFLLIAHDHQNSDLIPDTDKILMTHDQMSTLLGVRRESVSLAAAGLKEKGVIDYVRGEIQLKDRELLENAACECYGVETEQFNRILAKYVRQHGK